MPEVDTPCVLTNPQAVPPAVMYIHASTVKLPLAVSPAPVVLK